MLLAIQERIYKNTRFARSHRQQGQYTITTQNDIRNGIKLSGTPDVPHFFFLFNVIPSQMLLNSGSLSACGSQRNSQETLERSAAVCARAHARFTYCGSPPAEAWTALPHSLVHCRFAGIPHSHQNVHFQTAISLLTEFPFVAVCLPLSLYCT